MRPLVEPPRRRQSLALRISLLATAVAVITALVAGSIAVTRIRQQNDRAATQTLSKLADAAKATADVTASAQAGQARARQLLRALRISFALFNKAARITFVDSPLARDALTPAERTSVVDGASISTQRVIDGQRALVEARPTDGGGLVLVQRRADAVALGNSAIRGLLVALLIAVGIAVGLGLFVAWRLARPLRRTADAAHALASGYRDVVVVPEGPAEVAEVADAVNTLAVNLTQSEDRQRTFLMSVSHDLRTPLTAISGYAESLADGVIPADQTERVGTIMRAEAHRLERLVADLLDLARLGAQDFRVDIADVDVGAIVRVAGDVWAARCAAEGVQFGLDVPPGPLIAATDPLRLRQALDGLFDNALRVTPQGAPIVLVARREPAAVLVEVRDGGPGLRDEDLAVAFERSALYDRYRGGRQVGTGLGLAIVHGLVTRVGGTIEAGHSVEGGARFSIRIPAAEAAS
jgi:two-component system OmpR family sensor kinase